METVVITMKTAPNHQDWGPFVNRYVFDVPGLAGRDAINAWVNDLLAWEASFHSPEVMFLGCATIPIWQAASPGPDSWQNVWLRTDAPQFGFGTPNGTLKYRYGLRVPYRSGIARRSAQLYHGCLGDEDIVEAILGGVKLRNPRQFDNTLQDRAYHLRDSHFNRLMANVGGAGTVSQAQHIRVERFMPCQVSLVHATTRARFRNTQLVTEAPTQMWPLVLGAIPALHPLLDYSTGIGVDVVPIPIVEAGLVACKDLYKLVNLINDHTGSSGETDEDGTVLEPRFGMTRDALVGVSQAIDEWYTQQVGPWEKTLLPYEYAGDYWYTDGIAANGYQVLGKGISIAAPIFYADWVGMKEHKDGRAGTDPLPDLIELMA